MKTITYNDAYFSGKITVTQTPNGFHAEFSRHGLLRQWLYCLSSGWTNMPWQLKTVYKLGKATHD